MDTLFGIKHCRHHDESCYSRTGDHDGRVASAGIGKRDKRVS